MKRILTLSIIASLCCIGWLGTTGASASTGTYEAATAPGVHTSVDCSQGTGYVQVSNSDMSGSTVEVTIDGARQPDLYVDWSGHLQQWYSLVPGEPHRITIVYDFVPGGTDEEQDNVLSASCLDPAPSTSGPVKPPVGGGRYVPLSPVRLWDSRSGPGPVGRVGAGETRDVLVTGVGGVPSSGVTAVVLNVTGAYPSASTHVTAWPAGEVMPLASNLNVPPGDARPNLVVVKVGAAGRVSFSNHAGSIDLIADVAGYYGPA